MKCVVLSIEALSRFACIAPSSNAITHFEVFDSFANYRHLAHGLMTRLPEKIWVLEYHTGEHGFTTENMHIPMWTSSDARHLYKHFALLGLRCIGVGPNGFTGLENLKDFHDY